MRKLILLISAFLTSVCLFLEMPIVNVKAESDVYYLGGMTAGFSLGMEGLQIIGTSEIVTEDGSMQPAERAGLKNGDLITEVNGIKVESIRSLNSLLSDNRGESVKITIARSGQTTEYSVQPVKEKKSGKFKIGVLLREGISGIGTVTYISKTDHRFGSLGHAVVNDDNSAMKIGDPVVYSCNIVGVNKGKRGKAGELRGLFVPSEPIAKADNLTETGLYGNFSNEYDYSTLKTVELMPISEVKMGKAVIYSTVFGRLPQEYEIEIAKVDPFGRDNKQFVLKVTDERLIEASGGIVQGMSGSPIVQDGKLIGAVTHVFLNDSTRGYGIGIETMLKSDEIK